jgi:hypothetical protein
LLADHHPCPILPAVPLDLIYTLLLSLLHEPTLHRLLTVHVPNLI